MNGKVDCPELKKEDLEFITTAKLAEESLKLVRYVRPNTVAIIACPRSGLIPAAIVATACHLPLAELMPNGQVRQIGAGGRGWNWTKADSPHFLLVDDSLHSGGRIAVARKQLEGFNVSFAVVYAMDPTKVDHCARVLDKVHLFQWNWANNGIVCSRTYDQRIKGGFGFDMDGLICEDPSFVHNDFNLIQVEDWLRNVQPKNLPRYAELEFICSYRLEKHRGLTEEWLAKWGIKYKRLILCPATSFEQRGLRYHPARLKAEALRNSTCKIFFESNRQQAKDICDWSKKATIVPDTGEVFFPTGVDYI